MMALTRRAGAFLPIVMTLTLVAGCGGSSSDRAGGTRPSKPRVLTMATGVGELDAYAQEVAHLSGGTIRIEVKNAWRAGQASPEPDLIGDVTAGKVDLGAAGSRAWDAVGVNSFRALHAPLLIDSYTLEERVLRSPLATDMLTGLKPLGLAAVGILPGPMRKPLGITRPLVTPGDYRGLTIGVGQSRVTDATMRALGATPGWMPLSGKITRFGGIEAHLGSIQGNRYDEIGHYLTANVNLWPRPLVLFANRTTFDALTARQQDVLRQAASKIVPAEISQLRREDRDTAGGLCRAGERFITASPQDLAALRRAVQPVYNELQRDPTTKGFIAQINQLRDSVGATADTLNCRRTRAAANTSSALDGVWRVTTTPKELLAAGSPDATPANYGRWTYVFDRGQFAVTQEDKQACTWGYGTFAVKAHRVAWTFKDGGGFTPDNAFNKPGEFFVFGWSLYHDVLTLRPVKGQVSPENFRAKPWRRISTTPSRDYLTKRCRPPAAALPR